MIPQWLHNKTMAVFDLETDFIPTTQIFCNSVSIITVDALGGYKVSPAIVYTQYYTLYSHGSLAESVNIVNSCDFMVGHNIMSFDIPQVKQHLGITLVPRPLDTLILSKIIFSKDELYSIDATLGLLDVIDGSRPYALDAFGKRLGDLKIEFKKFSALTEEMAIYCNQDVDLTVRLFLFLLEKENFPVEAVIDIEHKAAAIIQEQTELGFYLDIEKTRALNATLLQEKGEIFRELSETFHPKWLKDGPEKSYKKISTVRKYLPNINYVDPWK